MWAGGGEPTPCGKKFKHRPLVECCPSLATVCQFVCHRESREPCPKMPPDMPRNTAHVTHTHTHTHTPTAPRLNPKVRRSCSISPRHKAEWDICIAIPINLRNTHTFATLTPSRTRGRGDNVCRGKFCSRLFWRDNPCTNSENRVNHLCLAAKLCSEQTSEGLNGCQAPEIATLL